MSDLARSLHSALLVCTSKECIPPLRADYKGEIKRVLATVDFSELSESFLELPTGPRLLHSAALVVRFRLNLALEHFLHYSGLHALGVALRCFRTAHLGMVLSCESRRL